MLTTDPLYYLIQIVMFPLSAVIFGYFLNALWLEIATKGWELSPRCVWRWCLTTSSFFFCVLELDPCSVLGILPTSWRIGVEFVIASTMLNSGSCTFYMYIIVLSKRHLSKSTSPITNANLWIGSYTVATIANCIVALSGAITNNAFWFGISLFIVISQYLILLVVINVTLHKMSGLLKDLETHTKADFAMQRRKIMIIRIVASSLIVIDVCYEFLRPDSYLDFLLQPAPPVSHDPEVFSPSAPLLSVMCAVANLILLYAMQRPSESRPSTAIALTSSSGGEKPPSKLSGVVVA